VSGTVPRAYVVHSTPGRTRLKVPSCRGDAAYFVNTADRLAGCEGVSRVSGTAATGSLLIRHSAPIADVAAFALAGGLFTLPRTEVTLPPLADEVVARVRQADQALSAASAGEFNLGSLLFTLLLGLAVWQLLQGRVLAPALSLLWWAAAAATWPTDNGRQVGITGNGE
jgi:hypothetical protein